MTQPYYPNLDGKVPYDVAQGIRTAYDFIHQLTARLDKIEKGNYVTREQAVTHLGPSSLRKQLQVTGSAPLNVTGLAGQLAQPQIADAQNVTALPPITDPLSQDGTLVSLNDQVYRFDGTTDPGTWKPITSSPAPGTAVTSLDTLTGAVTLVAGSNVTISDNVPLAGDITISASGTGGLGGGSGFPGIDGLDGEDAFAIPGAQGPQGNPGATGPQGPAGFGIDAQDPDEPMMIPGVAGPAGATGAAGATGPAGPIGLGLDGLDGEDGMVIPGPAGTGGTGGGGALVLLEEHTAISGDTQMAFTTSISATYDDYLLEILHFTPLTNGDSLWLQVSANGGSTWITTASYNYETWQYQTGFNAIIGSTSDSKIQFGGGVSSTVANGGISASIRFSNPSDTTRNKAFLLLQSYRPVSSDGNPYAAQGGGSYLSTSAYNAFRLLFSTGNIAAGIGRCYGIAK